MHSISASFNPNRLTRWASQSECRVVTDNPLSGPVRVRGGDDGKGHCERRRPRNLIKGKCRAGVWRLI